MVTEWALKINEAITGVVKKIDNATGGLITKFEKLNSKTNKFEGALQRVWVNFKDIAMVAAGAFAITGIAEFSTEAIRLAADQEKLNTTLTQTFQSAEMASAALNMIDDKASHLPFLLNDLEGGFQTLVARGIVPTSNEMDKLADIASYFGQSFSETSNILAAGGMERMLALRQLGITITKDQDNYFELTFKGVTTRIQKTSDALKDYILGLGDLPGIKGMANKIGNTIIGQSTILKNKFEMLKEEIGIVLMPLAIAFMQKVMAIIDWIENHWDVIKDVFAGIINSIKILSPILAEVLLPIIKSMTVAIWEQNAAWLANPITWVILSVVALTTAITLLWRRNERFRGFIIGFGESVKTVFGNIWNAGKRYLGGLGELLVGIFTLDVGKIKSGLMNAFGGVKDFYTGAGKGVAESFNKGYERGALAVRGSNKSNTIFDFDKLGQNKSHKNKSEKVLSEGSKGAISGSSQVRNITVNINKLVEQFRVETTNLNGISNKQIEDKITEVIVRAVSGAELVLAR